MELVYLWVEDYKNIKNQGFNFSPRFKCEFKAVYKKDENGNEVLDDEKSELIIEENKDYIENFFGNNINVTAIVGKNGSGKSSVLKSILEGFVEPNESNIKLFDSNKEKIENNKNNETFIIYWDYSITDENFKYKYSFEDDDKVYEDDDKVYNKSCQILPSKVDKSYKSKIDIIRDIQNLSKNILDNYDNFKQVNIIQKYFELEYILLASEDKLSDLSDYQDEITKQYFKDFYYFTTDYCYKLDINSIDIENNIPKNYKYIDFEDKKGKRLLSLSFGELQLMKIILNLDNTIKKVEEKYKYIIFLLDELELGLHPNWQKKIINSLIEFKSKAKLHFILTSHSPFLLSDIPKQNIIFLDTDENGNCIVVDGLEEKKKTFGANIHTLLSDSFFMKDGLMGEFAKSKIDEVIKLLNKEQLSNDEIKHCEQIISIIGDPIIKNQLQKMLDSKRLKKIDEIDAIKETIEELQKRLNELENDKS